MRLIQEGSLFRQVISVLFGVFLLPLYYHQAILRTNFKLLMIGYRH